MGPIQSGVNQLINTALRSTIGTTVANAARSVNQYNKSQKVIDKKTQKYSDRLKEAQKEGDIENIMKAQEKAPKIPKGMSEEEYKEKITKSFKNNPELAKPFETAYIETDEKTSKIIDDLNKQTEDIMSNLPKYEPISEDTDISNISLGEINEYLDANKKTVKEIRKKIKNKEFFNNFKDSVYNKKDGDQ